MFAGRATELELPPLCLHPTQPKAGMASLSAQNQGFASSMRHLAPGGCAQSLDPERHFKTNTVDPSQADRLASFDCEIQPKCSCPESFRYHGSVGARFVFPVEAVQRESGRAAPQFDADPLQRPNLSCPRNGKRT